MALAEFGRGRLAPWKIASFTGLTRGMHVTAAAAGAGADGGDPALDFPAGSHVGLMLHSVLERLEAHEAGETELMQRMLYNDIGTGD